MAYQPGHKVIVSGKLYKIQKVHEGNFYSCCSMDGCSSLILLNRIHQTYIGDADPEYYNAARTIRDEAIKLKSSLNFENSCGFETCKELDQTIEFAEKIMKRFFYEDSERSIALLSENNLNSTE